MIPGFIPRIHGLEVFNCACSRGGCNYQTCCHGLAASSGIAAAAGLSDPQPREWCAQLSAGTMRDALRGPGNNWKRVTGWSASLPPSLPALFRRRR